jgi:hypothetical protein
LIVVSYLYKGDDGEVGEWEVGKWGSGGMGKWEVEHLDEISGSSVCVMQWRGVIRDETLI